MKQYLVKSPPSPEQWTQMDVLEKFLNEYAKDGWELVNILGIEKLGTR